MKDQIGVLQEWVEVGRDELGKNVDQLYEGKIKIECFPAALVSRGARNELSRRSDFYFKTKVF